MPLPRTSKCAGVQAQQELLDRVMKLVPPGSPVGRPGFTSLQNQARFYYVIRKFGISKVSVPPTHLPRRSRS
jgi:hypothetical protein